MTFSIVVLGGTGNVGRGVVAAARERDWRVTVVDRDDTGFQRLADELAGTTTVIGSVADADAAHELASRLDLDQQDAVVVAVNLPWTPTPVLSMTWDQARDHVDPYLQLHHSAAVAVLPRLKEGGVLLGIGGGMADIPASGMGAVSMAQAAQRMLYRHLAREARTHHVHVREVMIKAMVHGYEQPGEPGPGMLSAASIGQSVCAVVADAADAEVVVTLEA